MKYDFEFFEKIYKNYNKRNLVKPDPLQVLYDYKKVEDRAVIALLASGLAYGRVKQILKSIDRILVKLGKNPVEFIMNNSIVEFRDVFKGFKHRFTDELEIAMFCEGIKNAIEKYGSLKNAFLDGYSNRDDNIIPALDAFSKKITANFPRGKSYLFPAPVNGSACKRPMLFLRWMVRSDEVDPGGWDEISPSKLIIPLDTHMYAFAKGAGFTKRKSADLKTACEISGYFKQLNSRDPVKYDFAITRFGIREELSTKSLS
jgi:uncharacterized protein (TIGR02757 family)